MRLTVVPDPAAKALVSAGAPMGHAEFAEHDLGLAVLTESGVMTAAIVFSDYRPHFGTIELSAVALHFCPLSTGIVLQLGEWVFRQLGCTRVFARTSEKNARAIKLLKRIGFTPEGTSADFYGVGLNARNYRMLKREWDVKYGMREAA